MLAILIGSALLSAAPVPAAETGHCDSKPFTLKKPAPPVAKPVATPAPKPVAKAAAPRPAPKAKPKYVIGCKQPK
jgi:hypothetical protein